MQPFTKLTAVAAPLPMMNIDTDVIIPKQFLRTIKRTGLGKSAFYDIRYHDDGSERADFVLNKPAYRSAEILVTGDNFGCGSSREHAPWALLDFGIRCVIAPSFADIFFNNSFKNGILPIIIEDKNTHKELVGWLETHEGEKISVDLEAQTITWGNHSTSFDIDPFRKHCLLNGLDDIGLTLEKTAHIRDFEAKDHEKRPWV